MENITEDEELDIRISNQQMIIDAAQMELNMLLQEKKDKKAKKRTPIGFTTNPRDERTTEGK